MLGIFEALGALFELVPCVLEVLGAIAGGVSWSKSRENRREAKQQGRLPPALNRWSEFYFFLIICLFLFLFLWFFSVALNSSR
jgi:hypothetical protein